MTPYLSRPKRSEAEYARFRNLETLRELAKHFRNVAAMHENSEQNWRLAEPVKRQADALEWVLDLVEGE